MADTGWLKPSYSSIVSVDDTNGHEWTRANQLSNDLNQATNTWTRNYPLPGLDWITNSLAWDWLIPSGSYPDNAVLVGVEVKVWGYFYQHAYTLPEFDCNIVDLLFGSMEVVPLSSPGNPSTQLFRIINPGSWPVANDPVEPAHLITFGGPTSLFNIAPGVKVSSFFAAKTPSGAKQARIRVGSDSGDQLASEIGEYLSHVQLKVYYEIPATNIDMAATPEVALSIPVTDLRYLKNMSAAPILLSLSIPVAQLGATTNMKASPTISLEMPCDISEGYIYIDSTAFPEITLSLSDPGLLAIRNKDMACSPEIELSVLAYGFGRRIDLSSSPTISLLLETGLKSYVDMQVSELGLLVDLDFETGVDIQSNANLAAAPLMVMSMTAYLEGDIILANECEEFAPVITLSINADLGYTIGLNSNPTILLSMNADGLQHGVALEFAPVISLSILANLQSKFAEPAPDHRTIFKCPDDRTIVITRKDKTIL